MTVKELSVPAILLILQKESLVTCPLVEPRPSLDDWLPKSESPLWISTIVDSCTWLIPLCKCFNEYSRSIVLQHIYFENEGLE